MIKVWLCTNDGRVLEVFYNKEADLQEVAENHPEHIWFYG